MDGKARKESGRTWCELDTLNFGTGGRRKMYDNKLCARRWEKRTVSHLGRWDKFLGYNRETI